MNLIEFLLGLNPKQISLTGLPRIQWLPGAPPRISITFKQVINSEAALFTETSQDLLLWSCGDCGTKTMTPNGDGTESVEIQAPVALAAQFFRINGRRK